MAKSKKPKLDFRKVELDLAQILSTSAWDLSPDGDERIFLDIVRHADCGLDWVLPAWWKIEEKMQSDGPEVALADAADTI